MPKILLLEHEGARDDALSDTLRAGGYEVVAAPDGARAVTMASSESPDLIVIDLNTPVLDGWSVMRRIKRGIATRAIPVIALTTGPAEDEKGPIASPAVADETGPTTGPLERARRLRERIDAHFAHLFASADASAIADADAGLTAPSRAPAGSRLLVVDDTPDNREVLARLFRATGFQVETAPDGPSALRRLAEQSFDAVLLDVMMPGVSGLEVLDEIRRTWSATQLPVIMATALNRSEDIVGALARGATDYVTKPFDFPVVLARVRTQLALKHAVDKVRELELTLAQRNRELLAANSRMRDDLEAAGRIQAALLPTPGPPVPGYRFAWRFNPSAELAGDIFNVFRLDDRYLGMYVLDVSGHGVAAALLSVSVSRFLFPVPDPTSLLWERDQADGQCRLSPPSRVAERLGERFPIDGETGQYFTLVYGLLDLEQNTLRYVSAGHPPVVHHRRGAEPVTLTAPGFPVGVAAGAEPYEERVVRLAPGDRVYVYSDGVTEAMNPAGELFGAERLLQTIAASGDAAGLEDCLDELGAAVCRWSDVDRCQDDQTVLCVERDYFASELDSGAVTVPWR